MTGQSVESMACKRHQATLNFKEMTGEMRVIYIYTYTWKCTCNCNCGCMNCKCKCHAMSVKVRRTVTKSIVMLYHDLRLSYRNGLYVSLTYNICTNMLCACIICTPVKTYMKHYVSIYLDRLETGFFFLGCKGLHC